MEILAKYGGETEYDGNAVSLVMCISGTPGITQTIIWLWVASTVYHLGITPGTSGGLKRLPFRPLTAPTREDGIFASLRKAVPTRLEKDARNNLWI